ncbi:SixA phosphatase family protein [Youngiibacter multivorans]|uniref:Phosphohistidine phosphatase n=1 Tax=Youngiibacter multivorans TaxID=937251 RepID=A0ABS4G607_9CLOT|nr:histidine phosphatase family protein [Youngiibacter multivorans]MBP1919959.1 phosphohistidine phosphatase [Youngiibacter multivorans]
MEIILFRHGSAEEKSMEKSDWDRELTLEGKEKVREAARLLKSRIADDMVTIWSSPMARAVQTAEILSEELGASEASLHECIASGDFKTFSEEAKAANPTGILIAAGHAPSLDEWCECMTGTLVKLDKSGAALIKVKELKPLKGKLVWVLGKNGLKEF